MSLASHALFTASPSSHFLPSTKTPFLPPPLTLHNLHFHPQTPKIIFTFTPKPQPQIFTIKALNSLNQANPPNKTTLNIDGILSIAEILCIVSSTVIVIGHALNCTVLSSKKAVESGGVLWLGVVALIGGVVVGGWIRRRQWKRVCGGGERKSGNLVERVERLEEEMRGFASVVRALSRQVEKLGIRFRVTRKTLKDPVAQTAALAQKNSEATRALAMQEDLLEKEIVEIQKVLLAMQEQQQKQLELILAIAKSGKLWESRPGSNQERDVFGKSDSTERVKKTEIQEAQSSGASMGSNNDRP